MGTLLEHFTTMFTSFTRPSARLQSSFVAHQGETAVFAGKDTMKTVMCDITTLILKYIVMTPQSLIIQSVIQSVFNDQRP